jgi:hypothetical protein
MCNDKTSSDVNGNRDHNECHTSFNLICLSLFGMLSLLRYVGTGTKDEKNNQLTMAFFLKSISLASIVQIL